jgi:hypothetical protein
LQGLRVFENRVLRTIFGPKRKEVTEGWRKLHDEELRNVIRVFKTKMRWGKTSHMGQKKNE